MSRINLRHLKIGPYGMAAIAIMAVAIALRIFLTVVGLPEVNSDEGTMGLEAMHIAFRGDHPIYLYGQDYMGVLEAYIAAFFFHLFGVSVFSLRLGMTAMFALFLISMYLLTGLLYTKKLALVTLVLLSFGITGDVLIQQLRAVGGAIETLLFGSIALLLASWLSLTSLTLDQAPLPHERRLRYLAYSGWGLAVGLGLWVHMLVVPFVLMGSLLLIVFCRRELSTGVMLFLLLGLVLGAFPLICYSVTVSPEHNPIFVALGIHNFTLAKGYNQDILSKEVIGTILWSLPLATGLSPICSVNDLPYYGPSTPKTVSCIIIHGGWSLSYIVLLTSAILLSIIALWKLWHLRRGQAHEWSFEKRQAAVIHFARLALLFSVAMTVALYITSPLSGLKPWSTRYLIGLLIGIPAVLWPLWSGASIDDLKLPSLRSEKFRAGFKRVLLLVISVAILGSTFITFSTIPSTQAENQRQEALIHDLLRIHATHLYLGYWNCYRLMFQSQEQIICGIPYGLDEPGSNRYMPYYSIVSADPQTAHVFPVVSPDALAFAKKIAISHARYRKYVFDGFVIYEPEMETG